MIDVEQGTLRPFEEQVVTGQNRGVQRARSAADIFFDLFGVSRIFSKDLFLVEGGFTE